MPPRRTVGGYHGINFLSCFQRAVKTSCAAERDVLVGFVLVSALAASGITCFGTIFSAPVPTISCNSAIICFTSSGLPKKRLSTGLSISANLIWPDPE